MLRFKNHSSMTILSIKRGYKVRILLKSVPLLLLVSSFQAQANTIKAIYANEKLYWQNAQLTATGHLVPTIWTPIDALAATKTWVPGGLSAAQPGISIKRSGEGRGNKKGKLGKKRGLDFSTDELQLVGVEYNIGSSNQKVGGSSNIGAARGNCTTSLDIPLVSVIGNGTSCFSPNVLELTDVRQTPFSLMRPVFRINEQAIITKLKAGLGGKPYPEGNYSSEMAVFSAFYHYDDQIEADTATFAKQEVSSAFSFELEIKSSARLDVAVKNGEHQQMQVVYLPDGQIEGTAKFEFEISGLLPLGYTMSLAKFKRNKNGDYSLINTDDATKSIPYSLTWRSAQDRLNNGTVLVDKGYGNISFIKDLTCVLVSSDGETCEGRYLDVDFRLDTEQADEITNGIYQSHLTLLFEPNL